MKHGPSGVWATWWVGEDLAVFIYWKGASCLQVAVKDSSCTQRGVLGIFNHGTEGKYFCHDSKCKNILTHKHSQTSPTFSHFWWEWTSITKEAEQFSAELYFPWVRDSEDAGRTCSRVHLTATTEYKWRTRGLGVASPASVKFQACPPDLRGPGPSPRWFLGQPQNAEALGSLYKQG